MVRMVTLGQPKNGSHVLRRRSRSGHNKLGEETGGGIRNVVIKYAVFIEENNYYRSI